jgi:hypothetical protein
MRKQLTYQEVVEWRSSIAYGGGEERDRLFLAVIALFPPKRFSEA